MQFPLGAARFPPPFGGGGRAQTTAPSGLFEKGHRISGNSVTGIARQSLPEIHSQAPLNSLYGISFLSIFNLSPKGRKNFPFQRQDFQRVVSDVKKTSKKDDQKAWISGKRGYFCTRNRGEVHKQDWNTADGKKGVKFLKINLQETKRVLTFAPAITAKFFTY